MTQNYPEVPLVRFPPPNRKSRRGNRIILKFLCLELYPPERTPANVIVLRQCVGKRNQEHIIRAWEINPNRTRLWNSVPIQATLCPGLIVIIQRLEVVFKFFQSVRVAFFGINQPELQLTWV